MPNEPKDIEDLDLDEEEETQEEEETTDEEEEEEQDEPDDEEEEIDVEALKKENETLKKQKDHWRSKAKGSKAVKEEQQTDISSKDMYVLMKAEVHEDDIDDVVEYAKFKKLTIAEAMKTSTVRNILKDADELRATSKATNAKSKRPGNKGPSPETLKAELSKGKVPKAGSQEAEDLFWARRGGKR